MTHDGDGDFDLAILGAGSAGFAAAIKGAELGARVALIEGGTLGGTCVNVGCVPSKTLLRAAETTHRRTHHSFAGVASSDGSPDWTAIKSQKDALVTDLRTSKYLDVLRAYDGVTLFQQRARFSAPREVTLADGRRLAAAKIIVATGSSPWVPPVPGLEQAGPLDSATAMALDRLPASMIVIGGGSVGVELAQLFSRLGVSVTLLEELSHLLPGEDPDAGTALAEYFRSEGLVVHTGVTIERVESDASGRTVLFADGHGTTRPVHAEQVLVATGRRATTRGLGLATAGVRQRPRGAIMVDEFLATSNPNVYAAGDVLGEPMFVYVAAYAGTVAADNALGGSARRYDLGALPRVTFSDPAVASVGLTEVAARSAGIDPIVSRLSLEHVPRSLVARDTRGFVKLVAHAVTKKVLGAQIVAPEAGEMIMEPALAIKCGLTRDDLATALHPYLTLAEGVKLAAQSFSKDVAKLSCCAA